MLKHNYHFQAVIAGIVAGVCELVDNVLLDLSLTAFLKGVAQWYSVKLSIGLSSRVR